MRTLKNEKSHPTYRRGAAEELLDNDAARYPAARKALLAALLDETLVPETKALCARALRSARGWTEVLQELHVALDHRSWQVRAAALDCVQGHVQSWNVARICRLAEEDPECLVRQAAVRALAPEADLSYVRDTLVRAVADPAEQVRAEAALAMLGWVNKRRELSGILRELAERRGGLADLGLRRHILDMLRGAAEGS